MLPGIFCPIFANQQFFYFWSSKHCRFSLCKYFILHFLHLIKIGVLNCGDIVSDILMFIHYTYTYRMFGICKRRVRKIKFSTQYRALQARVHCIQVFFIFFNISILKSPVIQAAEHSNFCLKLHFQVQGDRCQNVIAYNINIMSQVSHKHKLSISELNNDFKLFKNDRSFPTQKIWGPSNLSWHNE